VTAVEEFFFLVFGVGGCFAAGMFNFLLSKNVRKILKRKDSDAGEKGLFVSAFIFSSHSLSFSSIY